MSVNPEVVQALGDIEQSIAAIEKAFEQKLQNTQPANGQTEAELDKMQDKIASLQQENKVLKESHHAASERLDGTVIRLQKLLGSEA